MPIQHQILFRNRVKGIINLKAHKLHNKKLNKLLKKSYALTQSKLLIIIIENNDSENLKKLKILLKLFLYFFFCFFFLIYLSLIKIKINPNFKNLNLSSDHQKISNIF
jgi:hypothetical protein